MSGLDIAPPPIFTLRLGARNLVRIPEAELLSVIQEAGFDAFSLAEAKGWFRGESGPGWSITIAHSDFPRIATLADKLRHAFQQEGVGIEAFGRYLRCRADHGPSFLSAELWGLQYGFHPAYFLTVFSADGEVSWPKSFAIITAYATTGETWSEERNQRADLVLTAQIENMGCWRSRVTGSSPDGLHAEPGWALEISLEDARKLGREFRQDAVYFVDGGQLKVASCRNGQMAPVSNFAPRFKI